MVTLPGRQNAILGRYRNPTLKNRNFWDQVFVKNQVHHLVQLVTLIPNMPLTLRIGQIFDEL